jgi:hypothetical protein
MTFLQTSEMAYEHLLFTISQVTNAASYRNYGLESPRLLKRGMKSRSLFGAWGWVGLAHFLVIRGVVAGFLIGWIAAQFLPSSACSERMFF